MKSYTADGEASTLCPYTIYNTLASHQSLPMDSEH